VNQPITDHYGSELTVESVGCSSGYRVDLDWAFTTERGFFRFKADEARELAKRLEAAADEVDSRPARSGKKAAPRRSVAGARVVA
jgi:hypothetical protein